MLKNNVLKQLNINSKYQALYFAIKNNHDYFPVLSLGQESRLLSNALFVIQKGQGRQSVVKSVDTSFDNYLHQIVEPEVEAYKSRFPNHPFDDRKFRLHHWYWNEANRLVLELGPTMYQEFREDIGRTKDEALALMQNGLQQADDPYFYFSKNVGITIVVASNEQTVFLGERGGNVDYAGVLGFVGGNATFHKDLSTVDFRTDIEMELAEEVGLKVSSEANFLFIGIAGSTFTSEMDLMFFYQSDLPNTFFENCKLTEHQRLVGISNKEQALELLQNGCLENDNSPKKLMYPTRFGLEYLVKYYWK